MSKTNINLGLGFTRQMSVNDDVYGMATAGRCNGRLVDQRLLSTCSRHNGVGNLLQ